MAANIEAGPAPQDTRTGAGSTLFGGAAAGRAGKPTSRVIIHVDMDCFFAAVATLGHPSYRGKPLAVAHSNSAQVGDA